MFSREQEVDLVNRHKAGDNTATLELYQAVERWLYKVVSKLPKPPSVSNEEVLSDITIHILRALGNFNPDAGRLTTYLTPVARRRGMEAIRFYCSVIGDKAVESIDQLAEDDKENIQCNYSDPHQELHTSELVVAIRNIVDTLSTEKREAIELRASGFSIVQISKHMGKSKEEVKSILEEAKRAIADRVVSHGIDVSEWISESGLKEMIGQVFKEPELDLMFE